jgi:protein SCO1/2
MDVRYWTTTSKWGFSFLALVLSLVLILSSGCNPPESEGGEPEPLPVINQEKMPLFQFMNQDSQWVTQTNVLGKVHVMDFFFTSCPTICPRMKANMLTVYDEFDGDERVTMVSHSIDTRHDSVPVLHEYAERLEVKAPLWHFVTGEKDSIMGIARKYMVTAMEDASAPGGYAHSGAMILFDRDRNIRGYYDGTSEEETAEMIVDMRRLLDEK